MQSEIPELDAPGLRRFALVFALIITTIFGIIFPFLSGAGFVPIPWMVGSVFVIWALVAPRTIRPFYRLWMRFGFFMGAIMNRLILGIVFYLIIFPFGIVLRLRGLDPLKRKFDRGVGSYRSISDQQGPNQMRRPF
jgi:hypothetical protein